MITNGRFSPFRGAALRAVRICWISQAGSVCCQQHEVCQIPDLTRSQVEDVSHKRGSTQSCIRTPQLFHSHSSQYSELGGDISHQSTPSAIFVKSPCTQDACNSWSDTAENPSHSTQNGSRYLWPRQWMPPHRLPWCWAEFLQPQLPALLPRYLHSCHICMDVFWSWAESQWC